MPFCINLHRDIRKHLKVTIVPFINFQFVIIYSFSIVNLNENLNLYNFINLIKEVTMAEQITLDKIEKNLDFIKTMYDTVRLVDPVQKYVLEYDECTINKTDMHCYNYWKTSKICENCISTRAYHDNNSFIKLEYKPNMILMVTAIPLEKEESPVVLELLKNVTDSMMVGVGDYNDGRLMKNIVKNFNDIVIKDKLTCLYNRSFIDDRLPADIVNATITDTPLSVIFVDIDNLKIINDTYGHLAGDLALKEVGNAIKNNIKIDNDWAARYGGDEFLICLNGTSYDEAYNIAERIRSNIEGISLSVQNESIKFTVSLGIHTMQGCLMHTAEEIINIADEKMYEAKEYGKNRTIGNLSEI